MLALVSWCSAKSSKLDADAASKIAPLFDAGHSKRPHRNPFASLGEQRRRVDHFQIIPEGILRIEGQNPSNPVHIHDCHEFRIMYLAAQDTMLDDQAFPLAV